MKEFKLDKESKIETGFKTPDHYFETFSSRVLQRLPKEEPKVISLFQKRKFIIIMVAAVLVLALMIPVFITFSTKSKELDETSLETYLAYQSNLNQYDLISVLEPEDINKIKTEPLLEDKAIEDFLATDSDVENLLTE